MDESSSSEEEEEEVVYVQRKKPRKKKTPKAPRVVYVSDSESEDEGGAVALTSLYSFV